MNRSIKFGVSIFECYTPHSRDEESRTYYVDFCRFHDVRVSAVLEFHDAFTPDHILADPPITLDLTDMEDLLP